MDQADIFRDSRHVKARYGGKSHMWIWRGVRNGKFPAPDLTVNGRHLWRESTLQCWERERASNMEAA